MIKVKAKKVGDSHPRATVGIYKDKRIRPGEVFFIKNEKEMGSWMELVPDDVVPESTKSELLRLEDMEKFREDLNELNAKDLEAYSKSVDMKVKKGMDRDDVLDELVILEFPLPEDSE